MVFRLDIDHARATVIDWFDDEPLVRLVNGRVTDVLPSAPRGAVAARSVRTSRNLADCSSSAPRFDGRDRFIGRGARHVVCSDTNFLRGETALRPSFQVLDEGLLLLETAR
jgi:hypothetical protein